MTKKRWLTGLGAGTLLLAGGLLAGPISGFAGNGVSPASLTAHSDHGDNDEQDPAIVGSIRVDDSADVNEDQEATALQGLAKISPDQARQAALADTPDASAAEITLDNENGWLVYSVTLDNGSEVKVDAGNGQILATEQDEQDNEASGDESDTSEVNDETGASDESHDSDAEEQKVPAGTIDDGADLLPQAQITLDEAIAAARSAASGELGEIDLEYYHDTLVFNVDVGTHDVKVDASNGNVLSADASD